MSVCPVLTLPRKHRQCQLPDHLRPMPSVIFHRLTIAESGPGLIWKSIVSTQSRSGHHCGANIPGVRGHTWGVSPGLQYIVIYRKHQSPRCGVPSLEKGRKKLSRNRKIRESLSRFVAKRQADIGTSAKHLFGSKPAISSPSFHSSAVKRRHHDQVMTHRSGARIPERITHIVPSSLTDTRGQ